MFETWTLAVLSDTKSSLPIWRLVRPPVTRVNTSASRGVSPKVSADPWGFLQALQAKMVTGHCPELVNIGFTKDLLRAMMAWTLAYAETRPLGIALAYRVDRCTPEDRTAALHAYQALFGEGAARWFSGLLSLGLVATVSALVWAGPRVLDVMGRDFHVLRILALKNRKPGNAGCAAQRVG